MSKQALRGFTFTSNSDYDHHEQTRTITGRITKKRYEIIRRYMKHYNERFRAPYGRSERGYPYTCGHDHDCCGCLCRASMYLDFSSIDTFVSKVVLTIDKSFNY